MCSGYFIDLEDSSDEQVKDISNRSQQVALACNNGAIYIMSNFAVRTIVHTHIIMIELRIKAMWIMLTVSKR